MRYEDNWTIENTEHGVFRNSNSQGKHSLHPLQDTEGHFDSMSPATGP